MSCERVRSLLEEYRCGELDSGDAGRVEAHLSACTACSSELELLSAEGRLYRGYQEGLERNLQVPPGMWQSVREAIRPGQPASTPGLWRRVVGAVRPCLPASPALRQTMFAAALIVVSVGTTLLAVRYYGGGSSSETAGLRSVEQRTTLEGALRSIERAEQEYTDAIRVLSEIVDRRKDTMDPRLVAELEANLKAIDESIAATRKAYHEHPTDAELAHYMLAAYSMKVELLQEITS